MKFVFSKTLMSNEWKYRILCDLIQKWRFNVLTDRPAIIATIMCHCIRINSNINKITKNPHVRNFSSSSLLLLHIFFSLSSTRSNGAYTYIFLFLFSAVWSPCRPLFPCSVYVFLFAYVRLMMIRYYEFIVFYVDGFKSK